MQKSALTLFSALFLTVTVTPASFATQNWSRKDVIDYADHSPRFVAAHDKAGWVGLFTTGSFIQDPVGGLTFDKDTVDAKFHQNQVEMFWDAFIAKNDIQFLIKNDIVSDLTVVRDAVVKAYLPKSNAYVYTPAHLRYTLEEIDGKLRVKSLQAYWNMDQVAGDTLSRGNLGWSIMKEQLGNMHQGLGLGKELGQFLKAYIVGIHKTGPRKVSHLLKAQLAGNSRAFSGFFKSDGVVIFNSNHLSIKPADFVNQGYRIDHPEKVIVSGSSVAFNCTLTDLQGVSKTAVAIANFKELKIKSLEIFTDSR